MTSEHKITSEDIRELLDAVQTDRDARKVFLAMPREEQLMAILGMIAYSSSRLANVESSLIGLKDDFGRMERENRNARRARTKLEQELAEKIDVHFQSDDDTMTTTDKVRAVISKQYGGVAKFLADILKGVMQTVITIVTLALLYLAFGGKFPTP